MKKIALIKDFEYGEVWTLVTWSNNDGYSWKRGTYLFSDKENARVCFGVDLDIVHLKQASIKRVR